jgi:predicted transposase/invertase (TIGR01784 family)
VNNEKINILNDVMFKGLFGENKRENLENLLSAILKRQVTIEKYESVERIVENSKEKVTRLDLLVRLDNSELVNVEVQVARQEFYPTRVQFYWARDYSRQLESGEEFKNLVKIIHVSILGESYFKDDRCFRKIALLDTETQETFGNEQEYYFVETKKTPAKGLEDWIYLFKSAPELIKNADIAKIYKEAEILMANVAMRTKYDAIERQLRDEASLRGQGRREAFKINKAYMKDKKTPEEIAVELDLSLEEVKEALTELGYEI